MERSMVQDAVDRLQAEGRATSVRSVLAITGGSSRDVQRILKDITNGVPDDEEGRPACQESREWG